MHRFSCSSPPRASSRRFVRSLLVAATLLALGALGAAAWPRLAAAATAPPPPTVSAKAFVVMDQQTGVVLAEKNEIERLPMASTTKIMTGLLVLEHFHNLDTVVVARRDAIGVGEDEIYLARGERLTVDQLLQALLIQSANDAAADLADAVAGDQASFVALMNQRARELGLTNTHYANPHGLDQAGHYTSALDLTRLARYALRDPRFAGYVDHYTATIPWAHHPYRRVLVSHNELLDDYPWVYGVKTGWTDGAGYCIAAAGLWRGHHIMVTLLGDPDDGHRLADALKLFHWSASQYGERSIWSAGAVLAHASVPWHVGKLALLAAAPLQASLRRGARVTIKVEAPGAVDLPVRQGQSLGTVRAFADRRPIGTVALVAAGSYARVGLAGKIGYEFHSAWHWVTSHL
jgi:serine-type D-Ala-D-Ala carboxypeptidase (penicillin-binding protein 5/6)